MAELSQASSSVSSSYGFSNFDVFLSYKWSDTGNNFTSILHKDLSKSGITVFLDSKELWIGDAIGPTLQGVIERSKIWIPVFSSRYADSEWCLREIAQIVRCHKSNGRLILPIFCNVNPYDVQNQEGSFKKAFLEHQTKFNPDVVQSWRDALKLVGNLKGEVLDETRNQANLVDLVVDRVLSELINGTPLADCKYPVGIDSSINEMISLLNIGSGGVQFVGIYGFGGIGKTTIAKMVYDRLLSTFQRHSFIPDIRERAMEYKGLASLQKRLLKDIFQRDFDIGDHHKGKFTIKDNIGKIKVLVVLDDVNSEDQVLALAGGHNWFGQGSKVIITTRDEHILNVVNVDEVCRPQVLDHQQSLRLFSWHAFQNDQPLEDYMQLSRDVAHYSGGLPLTLEVLGSYLSDIRDIEEWDSTLQKLKEIPDDKVQRKLKISYDNLKDDYQKPIFLDAACFFIGCKKETVISIWEACGFYPKSVIHSLIKKSLLKFDKGSFLRMHDQIRDMGREIVRKEDPMKIGRRSRLWSYGDILEVLEEHKGTDMIEGISFPEIIWNVKLTTEVFQMMSNLRFLDISSTNFVGDISHFPSTLKCLKCRFCHWTNIPVNFSHESLVYLDLSFSNMPQCWLNKPRDENKVFEQLKNLNLSSCNISMSPHFSWFPCLEQLNLGGLGCLEMLHESICQLSKLKHLILENCYSLKRLPDGLELLENLAVLNVMGCSKLTKLPKSMGRMRCLHSLHLLKTNISKFPDDFSMLPKLVKLDIKFLSLQSLPELPSSLVELCCDYCLSLVRLPDLSMLKNLKELSLLYCISLIELPGLPSSLVELLCEDCRSLVRLPDLLKLKKLKTIKLRNCVMLEVVQGLEGTESLEELDVLHCFKLIHPRWRIHKQGKLFPNSFPEDGYSFTIADGISNTKLILCLVVDFPKLCLAINGTIYIDISVSIHRKEKTIRCTHTLRIEDVKSNYFQDTIFIHHFNGFDWFGILLQGKDVIEISISRSYHCRIKFCKLLYEPEQKKPTDFFNWLASPSDSIDEFVDSFLFS
ncbi:hypothetical protein NE237_001877 [Protea cynaroides]|uniref:TIR domain-containing protein n=1 Tax=Protea cynaroides TaxID=273540 RepID=A0A9Q0KUT6_9MAGN|nr:hypothetical protein NE237_001877 [Protea cynaroides]